MTDTPATTARTAPSARRAAALLLAWLAAAMAAGIPDDAAGIANANVPTAQTPIVQNTGPECFAGHAPPPPARSKSRD
jgi:hypothetical protein